MLLRHICRSIIRTQTIIITPIPARILYAFNSKITNIGTTGSNYEQQYGMEQLYQYEENNQQQQIDQNEVVFKYPYQHIPIFLIRHPQNTQLTSDVHKDIVAFKCLTAREEDLKKAYHILFPEKAQTTPYQWNQYSGINLFSEHFYPRLSQLLEQVKGEKGDQQSRLKAFVILNNMNRKLLNSQQVQSIEQRKILKESGQVVAHYCKLLIKHGLNYTHLLPFFMEKMSDKSEAFQVSKTLLLIENCWQYFPQKMMNLILSTLQNNFSLLSNFQLIWILRTIYPYRSYSAKQFGGALQQYLIGQLKEGELNYSVPLVLKTIKYCSKQGLTNDKLTAFMVNNMKRFQVIFDKTNISKGIYYCMLFTKDHKLEPELLEKVKTYLFETVQHLSKVDQIDQIELVSFGKLMLKYFTYFSQGEMEFLRKEYLKTILPHFNESTQALLYNLLVVLRNIPETSSSNAASREAEQSMIVKYVQMYFERCCTVNGEGELVPNNNINSVIQMVYQVYRHNLPIQPKKVPKLCQYNYNQKDTLGPEAVRLLFYYMSKTQNESKNDMLRTLNDLQPRLQNYIRDHRLVSLKTFYTIIDVCHRLQFDHPFFFRLVQNIFAEYLIKNSKEVILQKDIRFIYEKFILRGYGSKGMKELIQKVKDRPQDWEKMKNIYVENQKLFLQRVQKKRKERRFQERRKGNSG